MSGFSVAHSPQEAASGDSPRRPHKRWCGPSSRMARIARCVHERSEIHKKTTSTGPNTAFFVSYLHHQQRSFA
jgi:hypothetical protein